MAKDFKRISERNWDEISDNWLSNIPRINTIGEYPKHKISEIFDLNSYYNKTKQAGSFYKEEVTYLRSEILREGVFFAHKAIHVAGSAIVHLNNGILSWGTSSAYQASLFSIKSILSILGLSFQRINYKTFIIDCFPEKEKLSSKQRKAGIQAPPEMLFLIMDEFSHVDYWDIFLRILRVSSFSMLDEDVTIFFKKISGEKFVNQRNNLHYLCNYWIINEDLFVQIFDENFGQHIDLINQLKAKTEVFLDSNDFNFIVCYLLLKFNLNLLSSVANYSETIRLEFDLMQTTLNTGLHNRLLNSIVV